MTKRIFRSICFAVLAVFAVSLAVIMGVLYRYFTDVQLSQLRTETKLCADIAEAGDTSGFADLPDKNLRVTWIMPDGTVSYDSEYQSEVLENHLAREEVKEALESGHGESTRYSSTLTKRSIYCAERLDDGSVIRLCLAHNSVVTLMLGMLPQILLVCVAAALLALFLAGRLSKNIVKPLNCLNLDDPLSNEGYDELAPLLRRIDSQQTQLRYQEEQLSHKRDELEAVTGSMNEGLVLLNKQWMVISINSAAAKLFGADRTSSVGKDILTLNRSVELQKLLEKASGGERAEIILPLRGGEYQLDVSPVVTDGNVAGIALLMFDVTDKMRSEQMRREFTANVSHELKTPLHSISGYAELIACGMAKEEDVRPFAEKIYAEARRLIQLVEDIIRLSQLDEGAEEMKRENADLYAVASETVAGLEGEADKAGVTVSLEGESAVISCIPRLVGGIVYNLCDNAIKYNRRGGTVTVKVERTEEGAVLTVSDTGIGIPEEDQARIFERFYRVDKSRSNEVGGTGLGLSIVKHAAMINGAKVGLESKVGEGTAVTVTFPEAKDTLE